MQYKEQFRRNEGTLIWGLVLGAVLAVCFSAAPVARAGDSVWHTPKSGRFIEGANWSPVGAPSASDKVIFNQPGIYTVEFEMPGPDFPPITNKQLEASAGTVSFDLWDGWGDSIDYKLDPPLGIPDTIAATIGTISGSQAHLVIRGSGGVEADGALWIGRDSGSQGQVGLGTTGFGSSGGSWTSTWPTLVGIDGSGELSISLGRLTNSLGVLGVRSGADGDATVHHLGQWVNTGNLIIGDGGSAQLDIHGRVSNNAYAAVARRASSTSSVEVSGGTWNCNDALYVGGSSGGAGGTGGVTVDADGIVTMTGDMTVWPTGTVTVNDGTFNAQNVSWSGQITLDGDGVLAMAPGKDMAVSSTGTVNVNNGVLNAPDELTVESGGSLNLAGGQLSVSMDRFNPEPGTFNWTSGVLSCRWSDVTVGVGQKLGSALQIGTEKQLTFVDVLGIGTSGTGSLVVSGGGHVESQSGQIGNVGATTASAILQGAGSSWVMTQQLIVRSGNAADVTVEQGAHLANQNALVATLPGTTAAIEVKDAGTEWHSTGSVYLGGDAATPGGDGTLDLTNGGAMTVDVHMTVWDDFDVTVTNSQLNVGGALLTRGNFVVNGVCGIDAGSAFIAVVPGSGADIGLSGAGSHFNSTGSVYLGGDAAAPGGSGTLDLTNGATMTVDINMTVWDNFDAVLADGSLKVSGTLSVAGSLTATGTSSVEVTGGVVDVNGTGASLGVAGSSTLNVVAGQVSVSAGGTLDAVVTGDGGTTIQVGAGGTWMTYGVLDVGAISAGPGRVGTLTLMPGGHIISTGTVFIRNASCLTLGGGTITAPVFDFGSESLVDHGTLNGDVGIGGDIIATGDLTLGDPASYNGVQIGGSLDVGAHTVAIRKLGFFNIGALTNIAGGTLNAPGGVSIPAGNSLVASGTINGRIAAQAGSTIDADGGLDLGDATSLAGFFSDGELVVHDQTVTLHDANAAVLGSLTTIDGGTLAAPNGVLLREGNNVAGNGLVTADVTTHGYVYGDPAGLELSGYVTGRGEFGGEVEFTGTYEPGSSPIIAHHEDSTFEATSTLQIEIGGLIAGSQFDRLVGRDLTLGGTLQVVLIDEFDPQVDDTFDILDWDSLGPETFHTIELPEFSGRKAWDTSDLYTTGQLGVVGMLVGDTDVDWDVDGVDYDTLIDMFGGVADWRTDFNEDGVIDIADFALQRANYGEGVSPSDSLGNVPTTTPEPTTLLLLAAGLPGLLKRKWKTQIM